MTSELQLCVLLCVGGVDVPSALAGTCGVVERKIVSQDRDVADVLIIAGASVWQLAATPGTGSACLLGLVHTQFMKFSASRTRLLINACRCCRQAQAGEGLGRLCSESAQRLAGSRIDVNELNPCSTNASYTQHACVQICTPEDCATSARGSRLRKAAIIAHARLF